MVCFFSLDNDVETDETYDYASEELAQYQATECAGKYSLTRTIIPVSSLVTDSSVVYSASHYLPMLLFSESHHMSLIALLLPHFPTYSL